ncbi:Orphan protein [Shewanella violacea]|uniref:Uncharacterized protein n=1 Tax=Shewanella violacea (strain JCM 10179 / CIP 106290 / LMG 19151 / DSS12) TaxID=637905 RepID=D4ZAR9_SHEVD|nr:hypothetical protein SVI_3143 [Shewanella violacea DSS12]
MSALLNNTNQVNLDMLKTEMKREIAEKRKSEATSLGTAWLITS